MNNINDLKDLMRELEEAFYSGNQIPIDCVNYIKEWLRFNDGEEYNTKDWKSESEYYKAESEYYKSEYEDLKSKYDDLENKYAYLESAYIKSDAAQNSYKLLLDLEIEENIEYTNIRKSCINSLIQTNTLASKQKTYLMYDESTQKIKIGKSCNPHNREKTLLSDRYCIYLLAYCEYDIESVLHSMYSEYRLRGEWFSLSTKQVRYIIDYFGMKITNISKLNEFYETANLPF